MEREDGEGSGRDKKRSGETRGSSVARGRMEREAGGIREEKRGDERK
jgi:hypothetical protein